MSALLEETYQNDVAAVLSEISDVGYVSLTSDMWSSINNVSFLSLTGHYLYGTGSKVKMRTKIISCKKFPSRHTSANIQASLENTLSNMGIREKVVSLTTDNAANMLKASKDAKIPSIGCFAHLLNNAVTQALQFPEMKAIRDKVSKVVALTRRSTNALLELQEAQRGLGRKLRKLVQDVPTRWNSTYLMLVCAKEEKSVLIVLVNSYNLGLDDLDFLSVEEWGKLDDAIEVLEPCYLATLEMSAEKITTAAKSIPLAKMLLHKYDRLSNDPGKSEFFKALSGLMYTELLKRFDRLEGDNCFITLSYKEMHSYTLGGWGGGIKEFQIKE